MRSLFPTVFLVCVVAACASDGALTRDGDAGGAVDAGALFADAAGDVEPVPPSGADEGIWLSGARGAELGSASPDLLEGDSSTCFDGEDNEASAGEAEDGVDCDDPDCQSLPSCCVNNADCVGAELTLFETDFVDCAVDTFCGGEFVGFGAPRPSIDADSDTLVLAGDSQYDSGWLGNNLVDLTAERLDVSVSFLHAVCGDCLESAAIGFTDQATLSDRSHVMPLVALRAIGARNEMQLVVGDRVAATLEIGETTVPWTLRVMPNGTARAEHGVESMSANYPPSRNARLVLFGHNVNPSATFTTGARINSITVAQSPTDSVAAWSERENLELRAEHIAATKVGDDDLLALTQGETVAFYSASTSAAANWTFEGEPWAATGFTFQRTDAGLFLWARSGAAELMRAPMNVETSSIGPAEVISVANLDWGSLSEPTMAYAGGHDILVARVGDSLRAAARASGDWFEIAGLAEVSEGASHPTLTVHDDVYWVHFSQRRGTRDRVHAVVSDQLVFWRDMGVVLGGSAQERSFDRYSVSTPSMVADGDELRLYYSGDDLVRQSVGVVSRISPRERTRR